MALVVAHLNAGVILVVTDRCIMSPFPHFRTPYPSFSPSLISFMVSVHVKHRVYLLTRTFHPPLHPSSSPSFCRSLNLNCNILLPGYEHTGTGHSSRGVGWWGGGSVGLGWVGVGGEDKLVIKAVLARYRCLKIVFNAAEADNEE